MILKAGCTIKKHELNEDLEETEIESIKRIHKKELAFLIGQEMLKKGLIKIEEETLCPYGDTRLIASTVVLNPEQLNYLNQLTQCHRMGRAVMNEIINK